MANYFEDNSFFSKPFFKSDYFTTKPFFKKPFFGSGFTATNPPPPATNPSKRAKPKSK